MTKTRSRAWDASTERKYGSRRVAVEERARQQLASSSPCGYYFRDVHLEYDRGVLTIRGCVPTHTLKSLLDTILAHVEGVQQIDNQVVVSSTGLSSEHP